MKTRSVFFLAAVAYTCTASADYVVTQIDYVDPATGTVADFTSVWGNNNNGQVVGNAVLNGSGVDVPFYYDPATGTLTRLPQPPGFDGINSWVFPKSINDQGVITGQTFEPAGNRGFILDSNGYRFYSHPNWTNTDGRTVGNPTAAHPQGLIVALGFNANINAAIDSSAGFFYDPATMTIASIDTPNSYFTIAHGLNSAGQTVGHVRYAGGSGAPLADGLWGFLFTPTTGADPMLGGTVSYFRIGGMRTRARGINDHGVIAAGVQDAVGNMFTYVGTSAGYQLINVPSMAGAPDSDCPTTFAFPLGLNNAGQVSGSFTDANCANHGFIATPAQLPTGTTQDGAYIFSVDVVANEPIFIDPPAARAYDYATGKHDPRIATTRLPFGIGNNKFVLVVQNKAYDLNAGQLFDFRTHGFKQGVKTFQVACIDPAASLDPANSRAFPTELTFVDSGRFTGTQKPVTETPHGDESQVACRSRLLGSRH